MKVFRWLMVLGVLVCLAPLISVGIVSIVAQQTGCAVNEGGANPCVIAGHDWGEALYTMGMMGWLMLVTLPIAAGLVVLWVIVEAIWWWRSRAG